MKIFEHLIQLNSAVVFYRTATIAILAICASALIYMYFHTESRLSAATNTAYVLNKDGDVAVATRIRATDFQKVEAVAHVRLFVMSFFDIDKYTFEQRIASTYPLGNESIYALKQKFDRDNWFNNMRQYNVSQSVLINNITCVNSEPLMVDADFVVNITSDVLQQPQEYMVNITFTLTPTKERTSENPHALSITNIDFKNFNLKQ